MPKRDLISMEDLSRQQVELLLDTAESFVPVLQRDIKKVPTLRGRTVVSLVWEVSTRTSSSFDLAAKRLSADTLVLKGSGLGGREGRDPQGRGHRPVRLRTRHHRDARIRRSAPAGSSPRTPTPASSTPGTATTSIRPSACSTCSPCVRRSGVSSTG